MSRAALRALDECRVTGDYVEILNIDHGSLKKAPEMLAISEAYIANGNADEGLYWAQQVLDKTPRDPVVEDQANILRAWATYALGEPDEALRIARRVSILNGPNGQDLDATVAGDDTGRPSAAAHWDPMPLSDAYLVMRGFQIKGKCYQALRVYRRATRVYKTCSAFCSSQGITLTARAGDEGGIGGAIQSLLLESYYCIGMIEIRSGNVVTGCSILRDSVLFKVPLPRAATIKLYRSLVRTLMLATTRFAYTPPDANAKRGYYSPSTPMDEALLALLTMESRPAFVDSATRSAETRIADLQRDAFAEGTSSELTAVLSGAQQFGILVDLLEERMSAATSAKTLFLMALALASSGRLERAVALLEQAVDMDKTFVPGRLFLARLFLGSTKRNARAVSLVQDALAMQAETGQMAGLRADMFHLLGIARAHNARMANNNNTRMAEMREAMEALDTAFVLDASNPRVLVNLAVLYGQTRDIDRGLASAERALGLARGDDQAWHILALLLSSKNKLLDARAATQAALEENPDNLSLYVTMASALEELRGTKAALDVCAGAVDAWNAHFEVFQATHRKIQRVMRGASRNSVLRWAARACNVPAPSEGEKLRLWVELAGVYRRAGMLDDAAACVEEARVINNTNPSLLVQTGLLHLAAGAVDDAIARLNDALNVDYDNQEALYALGGIYRQLGNTAQAEHYLSQAIKVDPSAHETWLELGLTMQAQSLADHAANCFMTALELEHTAAIRPFADVALSL